MHGLTGGSRKRSGRQAGRPIRWSVALLAALLALAPALPGVGLAGPAGAAAARSAPAAQAPEGTVSRTANFLTDPAGRVVLPRGITVPAGVTPTGEQVQRWLDYGFTAVRLELPVTSGGRFPPTGERPPAGDREQGGLEQAAAVVRALTDRGLTVVLTIVPGAAGFTPSTPDLTTALRRLATRFGATAGLVGYEVPSPAGVEELAAGLRTVDPHHTLWAAQPAPFDPAARVAANGGAGYITGWADGSTARIGALADAGDTFDLGWFYDGPAAGRPATGIGAGQVRPPATPPAEIVQPYPVAVAGVPDIYGSDPSGVFRLVYRTPRAGGGSFPAGTPTAVVLPGWNFPAGYQARVTGGQVTSAPGAGVLCVVAAPGATEVRVEVSPANATAPAAPTRAGAANCPVGLPGTGAADGTAGTGSADPAAPGQEAPSAGGPADGGDDDASLLLLVALPALGAALATAVLGPVLMRLRRR